MRGNQSLKKKPVAAKQNLQVGTDPSLLLTLPCEFLFVCSSADGSRNCPAEMPSVSPGVILRSGETLPG